MDDYNDSIAKITGLNSISTLKRWRKKAEELIGVTFKVEQIRIGKQSTQTIYTFMNEDIQKFQQVADTKRELGLDKAIINAFTDSDKLPISISERVNVLQKKVEKQRADFVHRNTTLCKRQKTAVSVGITSFYREYFSQKRVKKRGENYCDTKECKGVRRLATN